MELCEIGLRQLDTAGQSDRQDPQREEDFRLLGADWPGKRRPDNLQPLRGRRHPHPGEQPFATSQRPLFGLDLLPPRRHRLPLERDPRRRPQPAIFRPELRPEVLKCGLIGRRERPAMKGLELAAAGPGSLRRGGDRGIE